MLLNRGWLPESEGGRAETGSAVDKRTQGQEYGGEMSILLLFGMVLYFFREKLYQKSIETLNLSIGLQVVGDRH